MKIGIIREGKFPVDRRVAFTPLQCKEIQISFPGIQFVVQPSEIRAFTDQEYLEQGILVQENILDCEVLFGVKEVPIEQLIDAKKYFFFSHTIKKQPYNKTLLQSIISKNITLVDYECLTNSKGIRVVAFGRFAGIVGAYNAFRTYGLKKKMFDLKPAYLCLDIEELYRELIKINTEDLKVILTGGGRVASGSIEVLEEAGFKKVEAEDFELTQGNVYLQLDAYEYNERKDGDEFSFDHFFANPTAYKGTFDKYLDKGQMLIAGAYWDPKAPVLFTNDDLKAHKCSFEVIADITCDINGSVPTTIRATTIEDPFYDFNVDTLREEPAFSNALNITVMSVDNLPCELSRDASTSFGEQLMKSVVPELQNESQKIIEGATICRGGTLTSKFSYLADYVA